MIEDSIDREYQRGVEMDFKHGYITDFEIDADLDIYLTHH